MIPDLGVNTCFILMASRDPASYANPTGEGKIRKNSSYLKECAISHNLLFKARGNHLLRHQGFFKATDPHLGRQDLKYASFFLGVWNLCPKHLGQLQFNGVLGSKAEIAWILHAKKSIWLRKASLQGCANSGAIRLNKIALFLLAPGDLVLHSIHSIPSHKGDNLNSESFLFRGMQALFPTSQTNSLHIYGSRGPCVVLLQSAVESMEPSWQFLLKQVLLIRHPCSYRFGS